jgi:hypothetical protein
MEIERFLCVQLAGFECRIDQEEDAVGGWVVGEVHPQVHDFAPALNMQTS